MSEEEDWWRRWFRRRTWWPFSRRWMFEDADDIFREIEQSMRKEFQELSKKAPENLVRERTLPDGTKVKEWGPFVYGYSVTIDPEGRPKVREFGNIKPGTEPAKPRISIREEREPLVDVMESDDAVKVIAEMPGVEKKDIKLQGTEDSVTISVDTAERKYHKEVKLPLKTDSKRAKSSYKNGVLEITMPRKKEERPKGEPIEIE
ncbi:Hsp20 family protein [Candidatus Bathyarchaeota archaeon]|nr:Hsp20 family protein [Candidatus Bathyarchaeota archaeon]